MKKLVVMGLAMAMTAAMVNGVCTQPVQAADGEGLKVAYTAENTNMETPADTPEETAAAAE